VSQAPGAVWPEACYWVAVGHLQARLAGPIGELHPPVRGQEEVFGLEVTWTIPLA
jgi:hypothetical protein